MARTLTRLASMAALAVVGAVILFAYRDQTGDHRKRVEAERKNEQLKQVIQRLGEERRGADVGGTGQKLVDGKLRGALLFVEYARDGSPLPAKRSTHDGNGAYT